MKEIILGNAFGLQGKTTGEFVMYMGFMQALFDMEKEYYTAKRSSADRNVRFHAEMVSKKRARLRFHLTKADILAAMILQRVCYPKTYNITNVSLRTLYDALEMHFEPVMDEQTGKQRTPIGYQEFVYAMEKFRLNGLINITKRENGRYDIQLNHIEGNKRFYTVFHPAFFSTSFTTESVAHMKFAIAVTMQAGGNKNSKFMRSLYDDYTEETEKQHDGRSMMYRGLLQFLHKTQGSDIRAIVETWLTKPFYGSQPLLSYHPDSAFSFLKKRGRRFDQVICRLNTEFAISPAKADKASEGKYHYIIEPTLRYKRQATVLSFYISEEKIEDYAGATTEAFQTLLKFVRSHGRDITRSLVISLAAYIRENKALPYDLEAFIDAAILDRKRAKIVQIAREANIHPWIAPHAKVSSREYQECLHAFTTKVLKGLKSLTDVRKVFHKVSHAIRHKAGQFQFRRREYETSSLLLAGDSKIDAFVEMFREIAFDKQVNPVLYREMELQCVSEVVHENLDVSYLAESLKQGLEQMESLTAYDFRTYPLAELVLQMATSAQKNSIA